MNKSAAAFNLGLQNGFMADILPPDQVFEKVAQKTGFSAHLLKEIYLEKKAIAPLAAAAIGAAAIPAAGALYNGAKTMMGNTPKRSDEQIAMSTYRRNADLSQRAQMTRDAYNPQTTSPFAQR